MLVGVLCSLLALRATALNLRPVAEGHDDAECRVRMHNDGDVDFTLDLDVDGQVIRVIPDTGSFAAVLFSDACESCGDDKKLLHARKMKHLKPGEHKAVQSYGSGQTLSVDAYAPIGMACDADSTKTARHQHLFGAEQQFFWMTVRAELPVADASTFQGIFGMGPPRSEVMMATMEARNAHQEIKAMKDNGYDVSQYEPLVQNLKEVAKFTKTVDMWLKKEGVVTFSVCLGSELGQDGVLTLNDQQVEKNPGAFKEISVDTSGPFWQADLSHVNIDGAFVDLKDTAKGTAKAILDTGTSLIGAPSWFVESVVDFVSEHVEEFGCDDASKWPPLTFRLNGEKMVLPGSSYVGKIDFGGNDGSFSEPSHIMSRMPHLSKGLACTALVFSTEDPMSSQNEDEEEEVAVGAHGSGQDPNPQWIFGIPFFRAYYTVFRLSGDSMSARRVFLAQADGECNVAGEGNSDLRTPLAEQHKATPTIDPSKLHLPIRNKHHTSQMFAVSQQLFDEGKK